MELALTCRNALVLLSQPDVKAALAEELSNSSSHSLGFGFSTHF